ncbi:HNH endonuclease [Rhizorhabdus wittichii]|uniref:HNH endonuclease n=2 Tax=Rhizorhabdus wittichii TaxID=160791 RepID=A0A975D7V1_9SPHN|nr:HNH endonuclease [Rhizorhabdus wittichii]
MTVTRALQIFDRDGYRCKACGSRSNLQVDHIVALANGGEDHDDNLQTLCGPCNASKGARDAWSGRKGSPA